MRADALGVLGELGSSVAGQGLLLAGTAAVFVAAPDIDHMALRILHHRSILTHSVLLPLLVLWLVPELGPAAASGAALGVAVHLAADLLSPSRGFGRIWLPEPFRVSLGGWSPLWLMLNALACAWLAGTTSGPGIRRPAILPIRWRGISRRSIPIRPTNLPALRNALVRPPACGAEPGSA